MNVLADYLEETIDNRGRNPRYHVEGKYPVIDNGIIKNFIYPDLSSVTRYIDEDTYQNFLRGYVHKNMPIMTLVGNGIGNVSMAPSDKVAIVQNTVGFNVKANVLNEVFLYYWLLNNQENIRKFNRGSGQPSIRKTDILSIEVSFPNLIIQQKIADTLFSIDKKIYHNGLINKNLEQQAQSIFQSWFIDSSDRNTWESGTLSDLIESTLSGDWGKESPSGKNTEMVYCIRGADIPEVRSGNKGKMPTRFILPKNYSAKHLVPGDIVVEISGGSPTQSTGRAAAISQSLLDRYDHGMVCTNFCKALKPISGYSMFVYYYWQYLYDHNVFFSYENGTTGIKNLDISSVLTVEEITIPPFELITSFDSICQSIFDQTFANGLENERLAKLRDTLLPKLMSGEIDISDLSI